MDWKKLIQRFIIGVLIVAGMELSLHAIQTSDKPMQTTQQQHPTLTVSHKLVGKDLQLDLTVQGFTFSIENMGKENKHGEGHVHLYVDGKKVAKIFEPTYVYKGMPAGKHEIVVELAHNHHESYGVKQTFTVDVTP